VRRLRKLHPCGRAPSNEDTAINSNDKRSTRGFLTDSRQECRERETTEAAWISHRESIHGKKLTVSYRCDTDATILPLRYPRRAGTIERIAAVKSRYDDTSCPYRMIRERRSDSHGTRFINDLFLPSFFHWSHSELCPVQSNFHFSNQL